jgi:cyclophilin family peptidyl-prolyl cis-trans isomerase
MSKTNFSNMILLLVAAVSIASCAKPLAKFTLDSDDARAPTKVLFSNQSEKAETYLWDFGDGNTSTEAEPEHKYYLSGNYTITLKAKKGKKENMTSQTLQVEAPQDCTVEMETSLGNMTIKLYDETPKHRDNFIKLAETGYYDGLLFHRIIEGFMVQGGDPNSKGADQKARLGSGGPGYTVPAEFTDQYAHVKGALCAARQGDNANPEKASSGSQFYIVDGREVSADVLDGMEKRKGMVYPAEIRKAYEEFGGTPFLDQDYTVYGMVVKGLDVLDKIASVQTGAADRPVEDVKILKVRVVK